jgi:hypothetical protein
MSDDTVQRQVRRIGVQVARERNAPVQCTSGHATEIARAAIEFRPCLLRLTLTHWVR